jgi:hypothetical protein
VIVAYTVQKLADYAAATLTRAEMDAKDAFDKEYSALENEPSFKLLRDRWLARKSGILTQINDLWLKSAPKDAKRGKLSTD